ncbi:organic cation transporter protein-like [Artemia franciscana]|uniref:organic cation transporter protein-like n=1 Tax=Artemia franciscana TaxID=6661 RepID=UPI0032DACF55
MWAERFGKYQARQYLLHVLAAYTCSIHLLSQNTVGGKPAYSCVDTNVSITNGTEPDNSCFIWTDNITTSCQSWKYDTKYYGNTIVTQWDLVCDRRWLESFAQTVYMIGVLIGSPIHGSMADKYGRKRVLCITATIQLFLGVAVSFCNSYNLYVSARFFLGLLGASGTYLTGFVLTMEMVSSRHRSFCGFGFQFAFASGVMTVAAWGYAIKDWNILQLVYGLHGLLLIGHWWFVDESPRWLYSRGRIQESKQIIQKAVAVNGQDIPLASVSEEKLATMFSSCDSAETLGLFDLLKKPRLRARLLNACFSWFANSFVYYGLSFNSAALEGNPHLMLFLVSVVELPAYVFTPLLVDRIGRRCTMSIFMLFGGVICIVSANIPKDFGMGLVQISTVLTGKLLISGSFGIIYNYTAELFPTVVRNSAIGAGTMMAGLSGALSPVVLLLDSIGPSIPSTVFGGTAMMAGFSALLLPETLNKPICETLDEGEEFGKGDTFFAACLSKMDKDRNRQSNMSDP